MQSTISYLGLGYDHATHTMRPAPAPTVVETPIGVRVSWGDREASAADLAVWAERLDDDGQVVTVECGPSRSMARDMPRAIETKCYTARRAGDGRYPCERPSWAADVEEARRLVVEAAARAEVERPDVAAACAAYREILSGLAAQHAAHRRMWVEQQDAIARRLRRRSVVVGEQTVPGLCVVRSSRGRTLAYAHIWDGRWDGRLQVIR